MHDMTAKRYNYIQICEHAFNVFFFLVIKSVYQVILFGIKQKLILKFS